MGVSGKIVVRVTGVADIAALAELRRAWGADREDPGFGERFAAWISEEGARRTFWLAEWQGAPIGMATLFEYRRMPLPGASDGRWGYLGSMFVREEHRDRGIGGRLLAAVLTAADERAYARVVLSPSERAVSFYRRAGFVESSADSSNDRILVRTAPFQGGACAGRTPS